MSNIARNQFYEAQTASGGFQMTFQGEFASVEQLKPLGARPSSPQLIVGVPPERILDDNLPFFPAETRVYRLKRNPNLLAARKENTASANAFSLPAIPAPQRITEEKKQELPFSLLGLEIQLTPNPTTDIARLSIETATAQEVECTLTDMLGKVIAKHTESCKEGVNQQFSVWKNHLEKCFNCLIIM